MRGRIQKENHAVTVYEKKKISEKYEFINPGSTV